MLATRWRRLAACERWSMRSKSCQFTENPFITRTRAASIAAMMYVKRLRERGLEISMTESNHCAENALAERMNGILKQEYGLGSEFRTKADAHRAVNQGIWLYNTRRPHTELRYRMPAEVHQCESN